MEYIQNTLLNLLQQTAFLNLSVGNLIMILVACAAEARMAKEKPWIRHSRMR